MTDDLSAYLDFMDQVIVGTDKMSEMNQLKNITPHEWNQLVELVRSFGANRIATCAQEIEAADRKLSVIHPKFP